MLTVPASAAPSATLSDGATVSAACVDPHATGARGTDVRTDPNEVTPAQAAAMESALTKALAAKGYSRKPDGSLVRSSAASNSGTATTSSTTSSTTAAWAAPVIDVYMHVITDGTRGKLSQTAIDAQIKVLNDAYASAGFSFRLASLDTTVNSRWYTGLRHGSKQEKDMKAALRKGNMGDLNIDSANLGNGLLGWATFPTSTLSSMDGVVLLDVDPIHNFMDYTYDS